ncbi:MAG: tetratricopeptide repeat protein [Planctomycetes bacterium]|nr:tetratricopeptide repeat protein [Planctomycetota bacterium]MCW8136890.1 tetratricopeptide repeat protein [Planctomycetota bacterium]
MAEVVNAEQAYLFRHALLRDAAYSLQPPAERAVLHRLAVEILPLLLDPDTLDAHSLDVADHARDAMAASDAATPDLQAAEFMWLQRAVQWLRRNYRIAELLPALDRAIAHPSCPADTRNELLLEAAKRRYSQMELPAAEARARAAMSGGDRTGIRARTLLVTILAAAGRLGEIDFDPAQLPADAASHDPMLHVEALIAYQRTTREPLSDELSAQALAIAQQHDLTEVLPHLITEKARKLHRQGRTQQALEIAHEALTMAQAGGNKLEQASVLNNIGIICAEGGRASEAMGYYRNALLLCREVGERSLQASVTSNAANLNMYFLNDLPQAERDYRAGLELALEGDNVEHREAVCHRLGALCMARNQQRQAVRYLVDALHCARKLDRPGGIASAQLMLSLASDVFSPPERMALMVDAIASARMLGFTRLVAEGLFRMTEFLNETGLPVAAQRCSDAAQAIDDAAPSVKPLKLFARGATCRSRLLMGDFAGAANSARDYIAALSDNMRHLRVPGAHAVLVAAMAATAVGPCGTRSPDQDGLAALHLAVQAMHAEYRDKPPTHHMVIAALEFADITLNILKGAPPYPLLMGLPVPALRRTQLRGILDCMAVRNPAAYAALHNENPELAAHVAELAAPEWLPWDTSLASVPGIDRVLPSPMQ